MSNYSLDYSLANHFGPFVLNANATNLPIDTHALMGMIVPRGLLVIDDPHQHRLSAPAGHTQPSWQSRRSAQRRPEPPVHRSAPRLDRRPPRAR